MKNPVQHGRTKHIRVKFHAIRKAIKNGEIAVEHCNSNAQVTDFLTKSLGKDKFEMLRSKLGVLEAEPKEVCRV